MRVGDLVMNSHAFFRYQERIGIILEYFDSPTPECSMVRILTGDGNVKLCSAILYREVSLADANELTINVNLHKTV